MKKALIICAGGMSSSLIAKKTTDHLQKTGKILNSMRRVSHKEQN